MATYLWFGDHVCDEDCDGPQGCYKARREKGRKARVTEARRICNHECLVRKECLAFAIANGEWFGIWGGKTERERRRLRRDSRA